MANGREFWKNIQHKKYKYFIYIILYIILTKKAFDRKKRFSMESEFGRSGSISIQSKTNSLKYPM